MKLEVDSLLRHSAFVNRRSVFKKDLKLNIEFPPCLRASMPTAGKSVVKLSNKACPPLAWNDEGMGRGAWGGEVVPKIIKVFPLPAPVLLTTTLKGRVQPEPCCLSQTQV